MTTTLTRTRVTASRIQEGDKLHSGVATVRSIIRRDGGTFLYVSRRGAKGLYPHRFDSDQIVAVDRAIPASVRIACHDCLAVHEGDYDHDGQFGEGPIWVVYCDEVRDAQGPLATYYTDEAVVR